MFSIGLLFAARAVVDDIDDFDEHVKLGEADES